MLKKRGIARWWWSVVNFPGCFKIIRWFTAWTRIYVLGSKSFRPDIQKPRQIENALRCWNKGRICWKIAKLFYFCHLKKLVRPETFWPYYVWHDRQIVPNSTVPLPATWLYSMVVSAWLRRQMVTEWHWVRKERHRISAMTKMT
jgi:hypothetical protein